jgi:hypothetical protein
MTETKIALNEAIFESTVPKVVFLFCYFAKHLKDFFSTGRHGLNVQDPRLSTKVSEAIQTSFYCLGVDRN